MEFNPYREWLEIDAPVQGLDYYRLLGVPRFESDPDRLRQALDSAANRVRRVRPGGQLDAWQGLLDELAAIRRVLTDPAAKQRYDADLQAGTAPPVGTKPAVSSPTAAATATAEWPPGTTIAKSLAANPLPPTVQPAAESPAALPQAIVVPPTGFAAPTGFVAPSVYGVPPMGTAVAAGQIPTGYLPPDYVPAGNPQSLDSPSMAFGGVDPMAPVAMPAMPTGTVVAEPPPLPGMRTSSSPGAAARGTAAARRNSSSQTTIIIGSLAVVAALLVAVLIVLLREPRRETEPAVAQNNGAAATNSAVPSRVNTAATVTGTENPTPPETVPPVEPVTPPESSNPPTPTPPPSEQPPSEQPPVAKPEEKTPVEIKPEEKKPVEKMPEEKMPAPKPSVPAPSADPPATMPAKPPVVPPPIVPRKVDPSPANAANMFKALATAKQLLAERNLDEAKQQITVAAGLAANEQQKEMVERLDTLHHYVGEFWTAVRAAIEGVQALEELELGKTRAIVVGTNNGEITIRLSGRNHTFTAMNVPSGLAMALATRWLDAKASSSKIIRGAFQAIDPNGDPAQARKLWEESKLLGGEVDHLIPVLDDKYDVAVQPAARATVKQGPVPAAEALTEATRQVKSKYGKDLLAAKKPEDRYNHAKKLLDAAGTELPSAAYRYALFQEARDVAVSSKLAQLALQIVDEQGKWFQMDVLAAKFDALAKASIRASQPASKDIALEALVLVDAAVEQKRPEIADKLVKLATAAAATAKDRDLAAKAADKAKELKLGASPAETPAPKGKTKPEPKAKPGATA